MFAISFCLLCCLFEERSRRLWRGLDGAGDRPYEAHHLACDGDIDDIGGLAARAQPTISSAEPNLRFPPNVTNDFWQRLNAVDLVTTDARFHSVSPGAFDQRAPGVGVAGLGDTAASDGFATRSFARDQAEIGHELAWVREACEVAHFRDQHHVSMAVKIRA